MKDPWLPFASSLCGRCAEVCPVKIDIPKLLLKLRAEVTHAQQREGSNGRERLVFRAWAWMMTHPRIYLWFAKLGAKLFPRLPQIGPLRKWTSQRELPTLASQSFHQWWATRKESR
jgi:L-lactate dehydrogenase complex protein LldF